MNMDGPKRKWEKIARTIRQQIIRMEGIEMRDASKVSSSNKRIGIDNKI